MRAAKLTFLAFTLSAHAGTSAVNPPPRMKTFINGLIKRMTAVEKAGQLAQCLAANTIDLPSTGGNCRDDVARGGAGSVMNAFGPRETASFQKLAVEQSRLKIPLLFAAEITHGYRTILPVPLAESCTWDPALIETSARVAANEAAANGLHWTFAPMVDVTRDPRWGRVVDGAGEDPWLGARIAAARVRGFQGASVGDPDRLIATAKHFVGAGAPRAGREYAGADVSARELRATHFPPFAAAIDAGVGAVMTSFGTLNDVPVMADRDLLGRTLRRELAFGGLIVSDFGTIPELVRHGVAADNAQAARLAFTAGVDVDVQGGVYGTNLAREVRDQRVDSASLDAAVRRVLELKYKLGLFSNPFKFIDEARARAALSDPAHRAHARDVARRAVVMLKNDDHLLPLARRGRIAVVGPLADDQRHVTGPAIARGEYHETVSLLEGLREATKDRAEIIYARGSNLLDRPSATDAPAESEVDARSPAALIEEAVAAAERADVVVAALGESFAMSGEAASRARLRLPLNQQDLLVALQKTGKPLVLILSNGRPLALELEHAVAGAILETWFLGSEHGHAVADLLFGDFAPAGKLTMSFPRVEGQIPIHYAELPTGRPSAPKDRWTSKYLDVASDPLYPFGFGLTYTEFKFENLRVTPAKIRGGQTARVSVRVTNVGVRAGEEVVQLYLRDEVARVARPVKELRAFEKIALRPGEIREVVFTIRPADLQYYDQFARRVTDPGRFEIDVGPSSKRDQRAVLTLLK